MIRALEFTYAAERCIAAAVLAAVLMAGLFVRAPWRVNAIASVLLANVVLSPWKLRLLFDIAVIGVVAGVAIWVVTPNNDVGFWRPHSFDVDVARAEAARAITKEENAAALYAELFSAYDFEDFEIGLYASDAYGDMLTRRWTDAEFPEARAWLADHAEAFAMLKEATDMAQCRFSLATTQLERNAQMLRTNLLKRWGLVLTCAVNSDLGEGRNAAAMEKIRILRRMAQHMYQQQMLLDMPRGLEVERMAYNAMGRLIMEGEPTQEDIGEMERWLWGVEDSLEADWRQVFEHEKLYIKQVAGLLYEVNEGGSVRLSRHAVLAFDHQFRMGLHIVRRMEHAPRVTALVLWFAIPHRPERLGRVIDRIFARYFDEMSHPGGEEALRRRVGDPELNYKGIIELAAWRTVNWVYPLRQQWAKRLTFRNAALVLILLKRHHAAYGDWPEALEEMADVAGSGIFLDPISGERLRYRRNSEGFMLYSIGRNGIDEDGRGNPRDGTDDVMIWPARASILDAALLDGQ